MSAEFLELSTEDAEAWNAIVRHSAWYDFYHRAEYHRAGEHDDLQRGRLYVYRRGDHFIALPLVLRRLPPGLIDSELSDATSVYGYAGPVFSDPRVVEELGPGFRAAITAAMTRDDVVSVFSRLNPLIEQQPLLDGLGECPSVGETVSIDLTVPADESFRSYRTNHRRDIRRLVASGMTCDVDHHYQYLPTFERLYAETMSRVRAHDNYFFDSHYFEQLIAAGSPPPELIVCRIDDQIACAGLFLREGRIAQYHLSGTASDFRGRAPLKLLIHFAADRYRSEGLEVLHLGGGIGGNDDVLLHFKKGFSATTHDFRVWRWIVEPDVYSELTRSVRTEGFFPEYRAAV